MCIEFPRIFRGGTQAARRPFDYLINPFSPTDVEHLWSLSDPELCRLWTINNCEQWCAIEYEVELTLPFGSSSLTFIAHPQCHWIWHEESGAQSSRL
jgi:hypothetical protein